MAIVGRRHNLETLLMAAVCCCCAGCDMKSEPRLIDHKDEYGEYRNRVRANVLSEVGAQGQGEPITSRDQLIGWWDVDAVYINEPPEPLFIYHLRADGSCIIKIVNGRKKEEDNTKVRWKLNDNGTFSLFFEYPPDPSIPGFENAAIEEQRRFLLGLREGRRVLWNGDGSSVSLLSPRAPQ